MFLFYLAKVHVNSESVTFVLQRKNLKILIESEKVSKEIAYFNENDQNKRDCQSYFDNTVAILDPQ